MAVIPIFPLFFFRIIYILEIIINIILSPLTLLPNVQLFPAGIYGSSHSRLERQLIGFQESNYLISHCSNYDFSPKCTCDNITLLNQSKRIMIILHQENQERDCALDLSFSPDKKAQLTLEKSSLNELLNIRVTSSKDVNPVEFGPGDSIRISGDFIRLIFRSDIKKTAKKDISFKLAYQPVIEVVTSV